MRVLIDKTATSTAALLPQNLSKASWVCAAEYLSSTYALLHWLLYILYAIYSIAEQVTFFRSSDVLLPPCPHELQPRHPAIRMRYCGMVDDTVPRPRRTHKKTWLFQSIKYVYNKSRAPCPFSPELLTYTGILRTRKGHTQRVAPSPRWARRNTAWQVVGSNNVSRAHVVPLYDDHGIQQDSLSCSKYWRMFLAASLHCSGRAKLRENTMF